MSFSLKLPVRSSRAILFKGIESSTDVSKFVQDQLTIIWRKAIQAFIKETIKHIRVDTSMSVASLEPVAGEVRIASIIEAIQGKGPKPGHRREDLKKGFGYNAGPEKSHEFGAQLGRRAYEIDYGPKKFRFRFKIVVFQYYLHEFGYAQLTAWDSFGFGAAAFRASINEEYPRRFGKQ